MLIEDDGEKEAREAASKVGKRICELRISKNISQMDLAYSAGISQGFLAMIETNRKLPTLPTIFKLTKALNVSPAVLFEDSTNTEKERAETKRKVIELIEKGL